MSEAGRRSRRKEGTTRGWWKQRDRMNATDRSAPRRASIGARRNPASQAAILAAARAVLAEGYAPGLDRDAVSRRAGAGKPTIYRRWWKNKANC